MSKTQNEPFEWQAAIDWIAMMEEEGHYIDFCTQVMDDGSECGGPMLTTEDSAECFRCGFKSSRFDNPQYRVINTLSHGEIIVNDIGEWV